MTIEFKKHLYSLQNAIYLYADFNASINKNADLKVLFHVNLRGKFINWIDTVQASKISTYGMFKFKPGWWCLGFG